MEVHGPQLSKVDVDETFAKDVKLAVGESVVAIVNTKPEDYERKENCHA
jgi:hypothetical protein